jgi:hypothetical protein
MAGMFPRVHHPRDYSALSSGWASPPSAGVAGLLFDQPTSRSDIFAVADRIIGHQSELEREVIEHILKEKEILSASQERKFYEIIVDQFASGGLGVHDVRGRK